MKDYQSLLIIYMDIWGTQLRKLGVVGQNFRVGILWAETQSQSGFHIKDLENQPTKHIAGPGMVAHVFIPITQEM